jgi:hypothetical protein
MKLNRNVVWHVYKWLRLGNFKIPAVAMETAKTLNLTQR